MRRHSYMVVFKFFLTPLPDAGTIDLRRQVRFPQEAEAPKTTAVPYQTNMQAPTQVSTGTGDLPWAARSVASFTATHLLMAVGLVALDSDR